MEGVSDHYKKAFHKITVPYDALTIGKVLGQGRLMAEYDNEIQLHK